MTVITDTLYYPNLNFQEVKSTAAAASVCVHSSAGY